MAATTALLGLVLLGALPIVQGAGAQLVPGSLDAPWAAGSADCEADPQPPIQVQRYEAQTFVLRQNPCATFEAPFLYLLVGTEKALLVDTGAVDDARQMPLAETVADLLARVGAATLPLEVIHTHGHQDHRAGDPQFVGRPGVRLVDATLERIRSEFGLPDWPDGVGRIELGERTVDVIPTPGHHPAHIALYDRRTGLFLSGDFLLPGRLLIDDIAAYRDSARRVADFVRERPVSHVFGAHVELDADGRALPYGSHHHPNERRLALDKSDLLALPALLDDFNGFYARRGLFILSDPLHNLAALAVAVVLALTAAGVALRRFLRRRKTGRPALPRTGGD